MNLTEKYSIQMRYNQMGDLVLPNYGVDEEKKIN